MKPVIGIPQMGKDLFRKYMKSKYVSSLIRAGAAVRWIEVEAPQAALREIMECDGLLLPGGADVAPALYGQQPSEKCGKPHLLRDAAEPAMLDACIRAGKPILCICRGVQMLNVCRGGTLHQDIGDIQKTGHADFKTRASGCHAVSVYPGSKLSAILGESSVTVNSMHHQAVDRVGEGLRVSAMSSDGIVEALELTGHPFCIGVQWHPEHMRKKDSRQQALFDAFIAACRK